MTTVALQALPEGRDQSAAPVNTIRTADCGTCFFKPHCLPCELEGDALETFERFVTRHGKPVKAGQILVRQGEPMHALYALRVGSLKAVMDTADGVERVVGFRFPGAVIGLAEPEHQNWGRTLVALEDTWLCRIPVNALSDAVRRQLVHLMSDRLRREYQYHLALPLKSGAERVASFLLGISDICRQRNLCAQRFSLPMKNADIASYLGMRHESLSRTLAKLQRQGFIDRDGKRIHIPDLAALRTIRRV